MKARWLFLVAVLCFICTAGVIACGPHAVDPCRGLSSDQNNPSRQQYLPCAAAMLDSLDRVDAALVRLANGDKAGRGEALEAMANLESYLSLVGGTDRLRESWSDRDLTEINDHLCNAYQVYKIETTGLVMANYYRLDRSDVSMHNVTTARRDADEARSAYRSAQ